MDKQTKSYKADSFSLVFLIIIIFIVAEMKLCSELLQMLPPALYLPPKLPCVQTGHCGRSWPLQSSRAELGLWSSLRRLLWTNPGTQDTLVAEQFTFLTVLKPAGMWEPKKWACSAVDALEAGRTSWLIIQQIFFGNPCGLCQDFVGTSIPLRTISVFDTFGLCSFLMQFLGRFGSWLHAFGEAVGIGACHEKKGSHIHSDLPH